jgi:hypothetical protein
MSTEIGTLPSGVQTKPESYALTATISQAEGITERGSLHLTSVASPETWVGVTGNIEFQFGS